MNKKIKVYVAVPTLGDICAPQLHSLRDMEKFYADSVEFVYPKHFVGRIFHDYARNKMVDDFLATDCDVMWFIDSDIAPPNHTIELVTKHWDEWKVAGAPYPLFIKPSGQDLPKVVFAVYEDLGKGYHTASIPKEGTGFVDGIATGCIFIKREVLEALPRPYFEFKYNTETREMTEGEDIGFCKKVNALGHKFFIDYSMTCHHWKRVNLLDVNNYAINEFNERWLEQDRFLRSQLTKIKMAKEQALIDRAKFKLILPDSSGLIGPR